jgi:crotonobetainyl-CoA:carnitine CoA-transferase CaiB-like acyl-CoA transferase
MDQLRPLAGIAIAEIGGEVATRYCARLFALMGADVWRAEADNGAVSALYGAWLDQQKQLVATPEAALAALDASDAPRKLVICGQTPARIAEAEALVGERDTPMLAISWFDPRGPYAEWRANDPIIQAMCGLAFSYGPVDGPPTLPQGCETQVVAGITAFNAALAALISDRVPRRIESNVFEAALCFTEPGAVGAVAFGWEARRLGVNRFSPTCPNNIYPTTDGYVGVTALTFPQWSALAGLIERPELATHPLFIGSLQRLAIADDVDEILRAVLATRPTAYWVGEGDKLRIPITPALPPRELPDYPHWKTRGSFAAVAAGAAAQGPTLPFRFTWEGEAKPRPIGGPAGPLDGVRVADFSMGWAGPLACRYLADLGADVLKVESSVKPDWWRGIDGVPTGGGGDLSTLELPRNFMCVNRNKRGLDLDLADPAQLGIAKAVVAAADVVLDNQGPGVMEKLGLAAPDQRRLSPAVVSIAMPPFGRGGPLSGLRAYGSTVEQASGMPFINGRAEWPPSQQHVAYGDPVAGLYGAAAALVGLYGRERLGGVDVDLCQVECLFQVGSAGLIAEHASGAPYPRQGSRRSEMSPCCVVAGVAPDTWLAVAADGDTAWRALATAIGRADLGADPELASVAGRKAREDEIEAAIAAWAANKDPREAALQLQGARVAASAVIPTHELFPDPHLQDCGYWALQFRAYIDDHFTPEAPFRYDGARPPVVRPAPTIGEHTEEVLAELGIVRVTVGA